MEVQIATWLFQKVRKSQKKVAMVEEIGCRYEKVLSKKIILGNEKSLVVGGWVGGWMDG